MQHMAILKPIFHQAVKHQVFFSNILSSMLYVNCIEGYFVGHICESMSHMFHSCCMYG